MVFTSYLLTYRLIDKKDPVAPQDEKKYIVFFSCLMKLFAVCPNCTEPGTAEVTEVIGTQISVTHPIFEEFPRVIFYFQLPFFIWAV